MDAFRKAALLQGLDNIGWTLTHTAEIEAYEARSQRESPWLFDETLQNRVVLETVAD